MQRRIVLSTAIALGAALAGGLPAPATPPSTIPPPFNFGGVIEGSYGPTWSHQDRVDSIAWMARQGLNTYIHAPKFDPYQRAQWRDPYPATDMADFASEISAARAQGVDWIPNVSPGFPLIPGAPSGLPSTDICFSCPTDVAALEAKLEPFFTAGATKLMVSFDDVQKISSHPEDAATYGAGDGAYGAMTRDLLNTLQRHFAARAATFQLVTVLADYSGTADTAYLAGVREHGGLDSEIIVLWTGTTVVAPAIRAADAAAYASRVGHPRVGIWDNYPANDYTGNAVGSPARMFLGSYDGRAGDLATSVSGIVLNVMNQAALNRFALGTFAAYVADPSGYQPEPAWSATINGLAAGDPALADALTAVGENSRSSALDRSESPVFTNRRDALLTALDVTPFWPESRDAFADELARESAAVVKVRSIASWFAVPAGPFLDRMAGNVNTARYALLLLGAQRPALAAGVGDAPGTIAGRAVPPDAHIVAGYSKQLANAHALDVADPHQVHGDRLVPMLSDSTTTGGLYIGENRVDQFVGEALRRTASWLPSAGRATLAVTVTIDGVPITLDPDGAFAVTASPGVHEIVATDGAGGTTGLRVIV